MNLGFKSSHSGFRAWAPNLLDYSLLPFPPLPSPTQLALTPKQGKTNNLNILSPRHFSNTFNHRDLNGAATCKRKLYDLKYMTQSLCINESM